ncbi:response regulator, partial [Desulfovibrio oxamicus]
GDATAPRPFVGVDLTDDLRVARPMPDAVTAADHLHLGPVAPHRPLQVIVADDVPSNRQLLAFFLEGLPHAPLEARGATEAGILYRRAPSGLVIMDGDMPEDDIVAALASIRAFEQEHGLPPVPVLVLVSHEAQAERMLAAGCTETLEKPLTRSGLRAAVQRLAPPHAEPELQPEHTGYAGYGADAAELPYGGESDDAHAAPPEFAELPDLFLSDAGNGADADNPDHADHAGTGGLSLAGDAAPDWNTAPDWNAAEATQDHVYPYDAPLHAPAQSHATGMGALSAPQNDEFRPDDAMADENAPAAPEAEAPTSWHPWERPAPGLAAAGATEGDAPDADTQEQPPHVTDAHAGHADAARTMPHAAGPDEAEELPDLFGAAIFAVGHAVPAAGTQPLAPGAAPASAPPLATGLSHEGGALPEGGSLLDLIVTDVEDAEPDDDAPTASGQPTSTPASAAPVSASPTPSVEAEEAAATVAAAATPVAAAAPTWDNDFEESVGDPMPLATAPAQPPVAGAAATTAR